MHTVAAVIDQGALTFDLAIPCEVFGLDRSDIAEPWYEFLLVAAGDTPVRTQTGLRCSTRRTGSPTCRARTRSIVPGWSDPAQPPSDALCGALRAAHARGARIVSLCTGAFVLATPACSTGAAPRPTGATPTTCAAATRASRSTRARCTSATAAIHTSAGTAAGIDLCLALVAADHGVEVAAAVARRLVMPLHRAGGQAQYVDRADRADDRPSSARCSTGRASGSATASASTTSPPTPRSARAR